MHYYLVNYQIQEEKSRIVIPMSNYADMNLLKSYIAEIKCIPALADTVEINNFKQVTEDVYNLISPFINSDNQ